MKLSLSITAIIDLDLAIIELGSHCAFKIYRRYGDVSRDRHFGGLLTLDSSDEPIGNGNASAFWYKPVIQFGFGVIEYTHPRASPSVMCIR